MFVFDESKVKELSMVDIAYEILKQSKNNYNFQNLIKEAANVKGISEDEMMDHISQLFTELNIDGRFVYLGQNEWGLKSWYPVDQSETLLFTRDDDDEDDDEDYDDDFDEDFEDDSKDEDDEDDDEDEEDEDEEEEDEEDDEDFEDDDFVEGDAEVFDDEVDEEEDFDDEDSDDILEDEEN